MPSKRALICAEDAGAANFLSTLPRDLASAGIRVILTARGPAASRFRDSGVAVEDLTVTAGLMDDLRPSILVAGTSEDPASLALALIDEARIRGIPCAGAVDASMNAAYRFRGLGDSPLHHAPDHLLVPDDATSAAFIELGFPSRRIHVTGHPYFDLVRGIREELSKEGKNSVRKALFPGLDPGRGLVVFIAEVLGGLNEPQFTVGPDYTIRGRGGATLRSEIALEEFLSAVRGLPSPPFTVLRLPPRAVPADFARFLDSFDLVDSGMPLHRLLFSADLVAGMTSMPIAEAALLGRPTLSILCREVERSWLPTISAGMTLPARTSKEVRAGLSVLLSSPPPVEDNLPRGGRERILDAVLGIIEGRDEPERAS